MSLLVRCLLPAFFMATLALSDNAPNPTFTKHSEWMKYYTDKDQLNKPKFGPRNHITVDPLDIAHLRLDCDPDPLQTEDLYVPKPYPMCDTLLQRVHAAVYDIRRPTDWGGDDHYYWVWTNKNTRWASFYPSSDPYLKRTAFGDSHGLEFPEDMEYVDVWHRLRNETSCTNQDDSCRTEKKCKMSWKWLYPYVIPEKVAPGYTWGGSLNVPVHGYEFGKVRVVLKEVTAGKMTNKLYIGVAPAVNDYSYEVPAQWGMASRGGFGGFDDIPFEWCRICAHTSCETTATTRTSELIAQPERCKAGKAQFRRAKAWEKSTSSTKFCTMDCPPGSWMTCSTGDVDSCEYPPWLTNEDYQKWAKRVMALKYGITIPKIKNSYTLLPTYYQPPNDLTQCFPCYLAANQNHYDRSVGAVTLDANGQPDYSDYYCPGGSKPPYSCLLDELTGNKVKAGADMKVNGPGPQACQCLAGYYSHKYDGKAQYKSQISGDLDCRPCPAGAFCRFRAENTTTEYGSACPMYQQKCPCPEGHWCKATVGESIGVPEPCDTGACTGDTPARTACVSGYQNKPSSCIACFRCQQIGGTGPPCLNMVNMMNRSFY